MVTMSSQLQNKLRGMLLGLATGHALGAPVEHGFSADDITKRIDDLQHLHDDAQFPKGVWTDDTSMALCLADSILACGGYDSWDVMDRYGRWMREGYRSYFDYGEGIGIQTEAALDRYISGDALIRKDELRTESAGNGSIMRLAPIVIAAFSNRGDKQIRRLAQVSARETHYSHEAEAATEVFAMLLYSAVHQTSKSDVIDIANYSSGDHYDVVLKKLQQSLDPSELKNKQGYVIYTLQISLWGFMQHDTFKDGMLAVMRLGGDVDTTMAVYGQLAGAYYGLDAIPEEWKQNVYLGEEIMQLADQLAAMKSCDVLRTRFEEDL